MNDHLRVMNRRQAIILIQAVTFVFITLLLYTALDKLQHLERFRFTLEASPWLASVHRPFAVMVPLVEMAIVLLLTFPRTQRFGLGLSSALLGAFTVYVAAMLVFAPKLPCGCGGIINTLSWKAHLFINGTLTLLAILSWRQYPKIKRAVSISPGEYERGFQGAGEAEYL
ncbi:MAG: hypothetical protein J7527_07090 [Chitinophagaceae bacterium]|nr:hypothetical protein [Chitinophagaceae bacterium]